MNRETTPDSHNPFATHFAEIEIAGTTPDTEAEAIPAPQAVPAAIGAAVNAVTDSKRRLFDEMRQIARDDPARYIDHSRILYHRDQRIMLSRVFYKQGQCMADFIDDFDKSVPFSAYYPYYQLMDFEQLRTYFTWRTRLRKGHIAKTALSYAFMYVYELINNIGVSEPLEGLSQLLAFWQAYRGFDPSLDKYILRWFKDYHVYYPLPHTFGAFVETNGLRAAYPELERGGEPYATTDVDDSFAWLVDVSRYDIRRSPFYTGEYQPLIRDCFNQVMTCVKTAFADGGVDFLDLFFSSKKKPTPWYPFDGALFFPWMDIPNRRVILSPDEIYTCRRNMWTRLSAADGNKRLIGYIMRRMESALRTAFCFARKMTGTALTIDDETLRICRTLSISLDIIIDEAVRSFHADRTRINVAVDAAVLDRVRREARDIQEKLIVAETDNPVVNIPLSVPMPPKPPTPTPLAPSSPTAPAAHDEWVAFFHSLTEVEAAVLCVILEGGDIQPLADGAGIMTEVLVDSINQKALDAVGDNVMEYAEQVSVYAEYAEPLHRVCRACPRPSENSDK